MYEAEVCVMFMFFRFRFSDTFQYVFLPLKEKLVYVCSCTEVIKYYRNHNEAQSMP